MANFRYFVKVLTGIYFYVLLDIAVAAPSQSLFGDRNEKLSVKLQPLLQDGGRTDIFIRLSADTSQVLQQVTDIRHSSREDRLQSLHIELLNHAERTQRNLLQFLSSLPSARSVKYKSFWVTNQIFIENADATLIQRLLEAFPEEIKLIYPNEVIARIETPIDVQNVSVRVKEELQWGLQKIQAPEAWRELGYRQADQLSLQSKTQEVRIATIDTGVLGTHEALRDNFLGDYGWFDPTFGEPVPADRMGHGTHTTATIAGTHGIGVAPWAKWMSCRACPTMGCNMHDLISCGQFFICPTLTDGSNPDCSKAPHLVSNSWSGGQGSTWYNEVIDAWHAAGIIPVFSIGNFGNAFCRSANSPGDQEMVIGVGSTTEDDSLSWFSSIGPTMNGGPGLIKPDVVAPGSDILSAYNTADDAYTLMSGTSMSAPHVSGIVALLLTRNPNLTFDEVRQAMVDTAEHDLQPRNMNCAGIPDDQYPNHVFGYGRVNALKSIKRSSLFSELS